VAGGKPLAVWRLIQTSVRKRDLNITAPRQFLFLQLATSFDMRAFRRVQRIIASRPVFHLEIGPRSTANRWDFSRHGSRRDFTALVRPTPTPSAHWLVKFRTVGQSVMA
jgi:hypothetical protein